MKKTSKSTKDTEKIAQNFLANIKPNKKGATVVGMYGELGVGKTTFVKNIGKKVKVNRKINSPTFVIMKRYLMKHKDFLRFISIHTIENKWMWGADFLFGFFNIKAGVYTELV